MALDGGFVRDVRWTAEVHLRWSFNIANSNSNRFVGFSVTIGKLVTMIALCSRSLETLI